MKAFTPNAKLIIRQKILHVSGRDPGCVHPDYFLGRARGGIHAVRLEHPELPTACLAVHFLPAAPGLPTRWLSFNLS